MQSKLIRAIFFLLPCYFSLLFSPVIYAAAYVVGVEGKIKIQLAESAKAEIIVAGTMLEPDIQLKFPEQSYLEVMCGNYTGVERIKSLSQLSQTCFKDYRHPDALRSAELGIAPIILTPRQAKVMRLSDIVWRSDVKSDYRIEVFDLKKSIDQQILSKNLIDYPGVKDAFTTFQYQFSRNLIEQMKPGGAYKLVVVDTLKSESSEYDHEFNGVVEIISSEEKLQIEKRRGELRTLVKGYLLAEYMYGVFLKEQNFFQESLKVFSELEKEVSGKDALIVQMQLQRAEIALLQKAKPDYIAYQYLKTIKSASEANEKIAGYAACLKLASLYPQLDAKWKGAIQNATTKDSFNRVCPLFAE